MTGCAEERSASFELLPRINVELPIAALVFRINGTSRIVVKARMRLIGKPLYPAMFYRIPIDIIDVLINIVLIS
jgi:hypothetical protein